MAAGAEPGAGGAPVIRVLDVDPDLASRLPEEHREQARRVLVAPRHDVAVGPWDATALDPDDARRHFGVLVVDGLMAQEVDVGDVDGVELVAAGDVVRPWVRLGPDASVPMDARWTALRPTRLAILDERLATLARPWPQVAAGLMDRLVMRAHWITFLLAVMQHRRVDDRLLLTLWHFADRWGRVRSEGIVLPVVLTHALLARIVGARRPSVTTALTALARAGLVERLPDGHWLLRGEAPAGLLGLHEGTAGRALESA